MVFELESQSLVVVYGGVKLRVEVINTGTELLLGAVLNTHGAWLGQELMRLGLREERQTTVPDGEAIREALAEAVRRAEIVILTGGLGPTSDDLTREITAELFHRPLLRDERALAVLSAYFVRRGIPMADSNLKQSYVPEGAEVMDNPNGTAPGIYLPPSENSPAVFLLPGPPSELHPMFDQEVKPRLKYLCEQAGILVPECVTMRTSGIGESLLHEQVDDELSAIDGLEVGYCARPGEVDVRLIGSLPAVEQGKIIVHRHLKPYLINESGDALEVSLVKALKRKGWTMTTAESCTGGLIAGRVTEVPGSSSVFGFGWVTYANEAKTAELGVPASLLDSVGAVSREVAEAMAQGALKASGADVAVAVTGIAGPDGGTEDKPVGTVWIAWAGRDGKTVAKKRFFPGRRDMFRHRVVQDALTGVFRWVEGSFDENA